MPPMLENQFSAKAVRPIRSVISIAGMPGVGKTTLIANLIKTRVLNSNQLCARPFLTPSDDEKFEVLDKLQRQVGRSSLELQYQRIYLEAELRRCQMVSSNTKACDLVVFDRGVEDTIYATEIAACRSEGDFVQLRSEFYPELLKVRSSLVVLLNASVNTLRERLMQRSIETGRSPDREDYFALFHASYVSWYQKNVPNCIVIETDQLSSNQVAEHAASTIQRMQIPAVKDC